MNRLMELAILQEEVQNELKLREHQYAKAKYFSEKIEIMERITELSNMSNSIATSILRESHSNLKRLLNV